jgi:ketosteroid isomerase-like protein
VHQRAEIVRTFIDVFNGGDLEGSLDYLTEDVRWSRPYPYGIDEPTTLIGRDMVRRLFQALVRDWEDYRVDALDFIVAGGGVIVPIRVSGRGRSSGIDVDQRLVELFIFSDDLIAEVRIFPGVEAARMVAEHLG